MSISTDDVRHVARLSRLTMTDADVETMTGELGGILDHIGKIAELDLADVPATSHALDITNVLGDDVPHESITPDQALSNAPDAVAGGFRVPRMNS